MTAAPGRWLSGVPRCGLAIRPGRSAAAGHLGREEELDGEENRNRHGRRVGGAGCSQAETFRTGGAAKEGGDEMQWHLIVAAVGIPLASVVSALIARQLPAPAERREAKCARLEQEIQQTCPHFDIVFPEEQIAFRFWFRTTFGTLMYYCSRCGRVLPDQAAAQEFQQRIVEYEKERMKSAPEQWVRNYGKTMDRLEGLEAQLRRQGGSIKVN